MTSSMWHSILPALAHVLHTTYRFVLCVMALLLAYDKVLITVSAVKKFEELLG